MSRASRKRTLRVSIQLFVQLFFVRKYSTFQTKRSYGIQILYQCNCIERNGKWSGWKILLPPLKYFCFRILNVCPSTFKLISLNFSFLIFPLILCTRYTIMKSFFQCTYFIKFLFFQFLLNVFFIYNWIIESRILKHYLSLSFTYYSHISQRFIYITICIDKRE